MSIYLIGCLVSLVFILIFKGRESCIFPSKIVDYCYGHFIVAGFLVGCSWLSVVVWLGYFTNYFDWDKKPFGDDK